MPIYEYECQTCKKVIEVLVRGAEPTRHDEALPEENWCYGALTKLMSSSSAHFKGGGWHNTDYGKRGPKR